MSPPILRVLMVEDSPTDAKLILHELSRGGRPVECERVEDEPAMREALTRRQWDLVLSDWSLPRFSGGATMGILRELGLDLPLIIVSGTIGEERAVEAMRSGARDFVLKDRISRLGPAVERELNEHRRHQAHQQAQKDLILQAQRFREMIEKSKEGISLTAADGTNLYMSPAAGELLGYTPALRSRLTAFDIVHPDDRELARTAMAKILSRPGASTTLEFRIVRADGSLRWLEGTGTNLLDDPAVGAIVANYRDVTDRKIALQALQRSEDQLRHAQKMEAVGRLAGGIAHDFNNLLSVILSNAEFVLEDLPAADPLRADVEDIKASAARAAALTRQLLTFSRQHAMEPKAVDLGDTLDQMHKMIERLVGEDIELVTLPTRAPGRVLIDPDQLGQVVMNLVINARDAMPTGGKLTIESDNVELDEEFAARHLGMTAGPHVLLAVSDTGMGMDAITQARIFEPFFTTKEIGKGTGLGLSTVFGIVQQNGGSIWVYSEPGHGSTFKIYLPRVEAEADEPTAPAPPRDRGWETVLLVEDEELVRNVARGILRRQGYQVIEANDTAHALALCRKHEGTIHLLLTDVVMPQMSGPDLARQLSEIRPDLKVLYMSGYTDDTIVRHGFLSPRAAYLQKPITPDTLARKLREVLGPVEPDRRAPT